MATSVIGLRGSEPSEPPWGAEYRPRTDALIEKPGGKIFLGSSIRPLEGDGRPPLSVVIIEFPSVEQAEAWHNDSDYAPLKELRQANIDMDVLLVDHV